MAKVHKNYSSDKEKGNESVLSARLFAYRTGDRFCIECSQDGEHFTQMRVCHMHQGGGKIRFGIYACLTKKSYERHI